MTQPPKPTAPWPRRPARWPPHHGPVSEPRRGGGLWDSCEHVPFLLPGKSPSSSGLDAWPTPVTLLPSHSAAPRLPSPRAHPTAGTRSPVRRLTVQGVGQHARHTLHHHLVGGLQESRGGARSGLRLGLTLTGSDEHVTGRPGSRGSRRGRSTSVGPAVLRPPLRTQEAPAVALHRLARLGSER